MPQIAAALMSTPQLRFYHDHVLVKEGGTQQRTPWHQDQPYYNVDGRGVSAWIPVDPVPEAGCLELLAASHLGPWLMPRTFLAGEARWVQFRSVFARTVFTSATLTVSGRLVRNDGEEVAAAASQARYNVRTPTVFASVQTTAVTQESAQGTTRLTFSRGNTAGIAFNYRVADVPGYHGQISATQVIDSSSSTVLAAGGATATNHAPGGPWLDLDADYPPGPAPSTSTWRSTDSPATGLNVAWKSYVRADRFTTYLMYKPNAHGIWVTLGAIDWGWSGFAARTGSNAWCLGGTPGCPMTTPSNWTVKPKVQVSATFPTWIAVRQAPNARP